MGMNITTQAQIEALAFACKTIIKTLASEDEKRSISKVLIERNSMLPARGGKDMADLRRGTDSILAPIIDACKPAPTNDPER